MRSRSCDYHPFVRGDVAEQFGVTEILVSAFLPELAGEALCRQQAIETLPRELRGEACQRGEHPTILLFGDDVPVEDQFRSRGNRVPVGGDFTEDECENGLTFDLVHVVGSVVAMGVY